MKRRVKHLKRGTSYDIIGQGRVQTDIPLTNYDEVIIYQGVDDKSLWVRPISEFSDGRFVHVDKENINETRVETGKVRIGDDWTGCISAEIVLFTLL